MQTEIITALEQKDINKDFSDAAIDIIKSLGLKGQESLLQENDTGDQQRTAYRRMTNAELFTYRALCPTSTPLEDYSRTPIPHDILVVAQQAKASGMFQLGLVVWDQESDVKDPVLVGKRRPAGQSWGEEHFILARWGEELDEFSTLLIKAREAVRESMAKSARESVARLETLVRNLESGDISDSTLGLSNGQPANIQLYGV